MGTLLRIAQAASALLGPIGLGKTPLGRWMWRLYKRALPKGEAWVEVHGQKMWLNLDDRTQLSIAVGMHEKEAFELFRAMIKPGQTVVDIGANVGFYTLAAARAVGPEGRVIAFEPEPNNCERIRRNLEANGHRNVELCQMAVGEHSGQAKLFLGSDCGIHSLLPERASGAALEVEMVSLDDYFERHDLIPDLVKIDAEGVELQVLRGLRRSLARFPDLTVICEIYDPNPEVVRRKKAEAAALLQTHGLRVEELVVYEASTLICASRKPLATASRSNLRGSALVALLEPWESLGYMPLAL
jgi:FkbM family methyltransferase